nr:papain-like cysteine protease family protein [Aquisalinus flavus]
MDSHRRRRVGSHRRIIVIFAVLRGLAVLALAAGAVGCAITPSSDVSTFAERTAANSFEVFDRLVTPEQALVLPVVHDRQTQGPACGAHALASVVNYWQGGQTVTGREIFSETPPARETGYSMAELVALAQAQGLLASPVRLAEGAVIEELERGRPVLVPVRLPAVYIQHRVLPGGDIPLVGMVRNAVIDRAGYVSELGGMGMVAHYLVVVGHDEDRIVVVEPIGGYRTISSRKLERYRRAFGDAAIVFSAPPQSD